MEMNTPYSLYILGKTTSLKPNPRACQREPASWDSSLWTECQLNRSRLTRREPERELGFQLFVLTLPRTM